MNLNVIDVDQTLFHTESVVRVLRGSKEVHRLSSADFNSYLLRDGEEFDFSDFRCSETFAKSAKPIYAAHDFVQSLEWSDTFVYLTARGMVDNIHTFLRPFRQYDLPMAPVLFSGEYGNSPVENKRLVLRHLLKLTGCRKMVMMDDHSKHLDMALGLTHEFHSLNITTYLVKNDQVTIYPKEL